MGQKSRAKRVARQEKAASGTHAHKRGRRGFSRIQQVFLLGVVAVVVVALGVMARSALTSTPTTAPSSTPTSDMSSMNHSSDGQGIAIGKRVAMTDMAVPASSGGHVALRKYLGKKLVVYFYEGVT